MSKSKLAVLILFALLALTGTHAFLLHSELTLVKNERDYYLLVAIRAQGEIVKFKRERLRQGMVRYVQSVNPQAPAEEIASATMLAYERYGIDPILLLAQQHVESHFRPDAVSETGARCLMQIVKRTAERELHVKWDKVFDIHTCIDAGARYMLRHLKRYGDVNAALARYCGGCDPNYETKVLRALYSIGSFVNIQPAT